MKKSILLSTIILLLNSIPAFSQYIIETEAEELKKIINVNDYEEFIYDELGNKIYIINIKSQISSSDPDLLTKAVYEKNDRAVEIILEHLNWNYDFFEEKNYDNNEYNNIIEISGKYGTNKIKTMIYDAVLPEVVGEYDHSYEIFEKQFNLGNKDFLSYVLSKNNRGFIVKGNIDKLVTRTVEKANVPLLKFLLENGVNPSELDLLAYLSVYGFSEEVSYEAKVEVIDLLLAYGDNIDIFSILNKRVITDCFKYSYDADFLSLMLKKGMPIDLVKKDCLLVLFEHSSKFISDEKGFNVVSLLIKAGADVNSIEKESGESVLYKACWKDSKESKVIKLLLDNGAKVKVTLKQRIKKKYPVDVALYCGKYEAIKEMKNHGLKLKGKRILYAAAESPDDNVECLKLVLEENKKFDKKNIFGKTAFWYASEHCNAKVMKYLKDLGADINVQDRINGQTGIMSHFYNKWFFDDKGVIDALNVGVDLTIKDKKGKTARDYALIIAEDTSDEDLKNRINNIISEIDRILSNDGSSIELTIYDAVKTSNYDALINLLKNPEEKAKINVQDENGKYAIEYAVKRNDSKTVGILCKNKSVFLNQMIKDAIKYDNIEMIDAFFSNGVDVNISLSDDENSKDEFLETPLMYAIKETAARKTILNLLKYKPDLNRYYGKSEHNPKGYNVLYGMVKYYGYRDISEILIALMEAGADPFYNDYEFFKKYLESEDKDKDQVLDKIIEPEGMAEKLYDEYGYFLGEEENLRWYDVHVQERILKGKILTARENINIRNYNYHEEFEVTCTLKAGSKVKVLGVNNREEIDGMNKYWVVVEITEDAETVNGNPIPPETKGLCYSGYLE